MPHQLRVTIVAFAIFSATFSNNSLSAIYVIYEKRFGFSSLSATAIYATYAIAVLLALLCVGRLSDDIGRKPLLIGGMLVMLASTVVFFGATGTWALFVGRAILGLASGTIAATGGGALVDLERNGDHQHASLLTTLAFLCGAAFGPLMFGIVAQYLSDPIRTPFVIEFGLELLVLFGLILAPEPARYERVPFRWRIQRPKVPAEILAPFLVAGAVVSVGWIIGGIYGALSGSLDSQLLHVYNHALAGVVLFIFAFIAGASQIALRKMSPRATMTFGIVSAVIGVVLLETSLVTVSAPLLLLATVFVGAANGLTFVGSLALINVIAPPAQRAEIISAYSVVGYFALSLPVIGVGLLANEFGLKSAALIFTIVLVGLSFLTLAVLHRNTLSAASLTGNSELAPIE